MRSLRRGEGTGSAALLLRVAVVLGTAALLPVPLGAQGPIGDPTGRSGDPPRFQREEPKPPPPAPVLPAPPPPTRPERTPVPAIQVLVREIRVVGSTVFTPEEIVRVTAPYVDRELAAEDLEDLRVALTRLYVDRGYVNSGAILPDQDVTGGVVVYQIIEGQLADIEVDGNRWFRAGYLRKRLALGARPPLNINTLQERLQQLLEDPRLRRLNAELKPGLGPGEATLTVLVEERLPYRLTLDVNNHQSPSVGAERGIATIEHQNLTGWGDIVTLQYGKSEGLDPLLDFRYALPVTARDTTVNVQYRRNTFAVVEQPFRELEIESESEIYTFGVRHPIYRTSSAEVTLELLGEHLRHETFLLGRPFTLAPGARDGESVVTAIRTAQEFVHRTQNQVIAARSRFSVGIDALGATINRGDVPDGQFFAWLGQFQAVRRFGFLDTQAILRSDLQIADDPLLTLEQIAIGGRFSVRGYRENTFVRDNAYLASLEVRVPLIRNTRWAEYVQLAPFADYGRAWNVRRPRGDPPDIASVGIGLRWAATIPGAISLRPLLEVYWGHPLRELRTPEEDLQDKGVHFQFVLATF